MAVGSSELERRRAREADEAEQARLDDPDFGKHWGDPGVEVQDVPADERELYMKQAGPVGEAFRTAWNRYEAEEAIERGDEPNAVARERTRLEERGQVGPADSPPGANDPGGARDMAAADAELDLGPDDDEDDEDEDGQEPRGVGDGGTLSERQQAEQKAAALGLEIRDQGTAGDWRVYDPSSGRQVSKSRLDEQNSTLGGGASVSGSTS